MFGGDEVSAIVLDVGSATTRAGYAGEDTPKAVFPSCVGVFDQGSGADAMQIDSLSAGASEKSHNTYFVGNSAVNFRRDNVEMKGPMESGLIKDWDVMEQLWDHAFHKCLLADPKEHPLMVAEPSIHSRQSREKMAEILFEKYQAPAIFLSKSAVLSSFASGRATALVLDVGAKTTYAVPVHDGYALQKSILKYDVGGDFLTAELLKGLESNDVTVRPPWSFTKKVSSDGQISLTHHTFPKTHPSYVLFSKLEVIRDLKESLCRVAEQAFEEIAYQSLPNYIVPYELPDGTTVDVGPEKYKIPELLFNGQGLNMEPVSFPGVHQMVVDSVSKCDLDIRREMYGNIIVTGGSSLFPGFVDRLQRELADVAPPTVKIKIIASNSSTERKFSSWIGGSILASLGSFQQMWMSKQEYAEHGATLVERKCP
eukprot:GILK01003349.1.p1 GENE.GILK01003349.1~~GILK01003349.1.p1  ORF type:complete len:426 (-),score=47.17 GILK01003349.1:181-1458(-)